MARQLSNAAVQSINASETGEVWLALIELTHASFGSPIRLVRNNASIVHAGNTYSAFPFSVMLPDDEPEIVPVVRWVAYNVDQSLTTALRSVTGPITGKLSYVLADTPDIVEIGPMEMQMSGFEFDSLTISGNMTIEPVLDALFGSKRMDGGNAPGLF